jgi:GLPGLI family protein
MNQPLKQTFFLVMLFSCVAARAQGQVYTESVTTGLAQEQINTKSYYMPRMFKMIQNNGNVIIIRLDKELMISVNNENKEYSQMNFTELEAMMKKLRSKVDTAMQEMQKKMADMPPEQRKMMEQMMAKSFGVGSSGGKLEVKKSGESRTISGYACTKLVVTQDDKEVLVLWTTKDIKEFASIRNDYEQLATRISSVMASNNRWGGGALAQAWPEAMKVIDGFPIQQEMGGIKTVVTKIEKKSTPASEFEPPAGYKRVESASLER